MLILGIVFLVCLHLPTNSLQRTLINDEWSGAISSNLGVAKYSKDQELEWLITAPSGGKYIELTFDAFETECLYDYVTVYDGIDEESRVQLASMSGNLHKSNKIVSHSGKLYIYFVSDTDTVLRGFRATFNVMACPNNCTGANGRCDEKEHKCTCNTEWFGEACDMMAVECGSHGLFDTQLNKCRCEAGYIGTKCDVSFPTLQSPSSSQFHQWFSLYHSKQSPVPDQNLDGFQMMSPRQGHTADVIGDYLFVFGGFDLNQVMYSFVKLDMISGIWSDVLVDLSCISIPTGRHMHSSVVFQDSILYCGGFLQVGAGLSDECWLYNSTTSWWYRYPSLPSPVAGHSLTLAPPTSVYLFGGLTGVDTSNYSDSLHILTLLDNNTIPLSWELVTPVFLPTKQLRRYGHSAVFHSPSLLVFGGFVPQPHVLIKKSPDVWVYNIERSVWSLLETNAAGRGLVFHTAVVLGRYMVVFGGSPADDYQATCFNEVLFVFDMGCMDWTTVSSLTLKSFQDIATPRYGQAAAVYHNTMVIVGGFNGQPLSDVLLYFPPREDCTAIPRRGPMAGVHDECGVLQHCVRCGKRCKPVDRCRNRLSQCSVCYRLQHCAECTLWGCEWCVQEASCRSRDSGNLCGVQSPEPWWGPEGTLLHTPMECQAEDKPPGLHWIKYLDPANRTHPDDVSIVRKADVHLIHDAGASNPVSNDARYWGFLQGFINVLHAPDISPDNIKVVYMNGLVVIHAGVSRFNATRVMSGSSMFVKREWEYKLPAADVIYVMAELSQYLADQQRVSNLTLLWNRAGSYRSDQVMTEGVLEPFKEGSCEQHITCLGCLTDQLCGWNTTHVICQKRPASRDLMIGPRDLMQDYLITDVSNCITCSDHVFCNACNTRDECEWVGFRCARRGRYIAPPSRHCPDGCAARGSCLSCTEQDDCLWCKAAQRCVSLNVHVALFPYGSCSAWVNRYIAQGDLADRCATCERYTRCSECLAVSGCGWCGEESAPHTGSCMQGNFEEGSCDRLPFSYIWYFAQCPAVNECALGLHSCHQHAKCEDTLSGYLCRCKPGFQGDGKGGCISLCGAGETCKHGTCNSYNLCECDVGYTGPNCDQDCLCNGHSTCSQGQGQCDECLYLTEGDRCENCRAGAYRLGHLTRSVCEPCQCNGHHDPNLGYCDRNTGQCHCTGHTRGFNCQHCGDGYYGGAVDGGKCYMVARSRVKMTGSEDGALGNVVINRQLRDIERGHQSVMWYIAPEVSAASVVVVIDAFSSTSSSLPGTLYIWQGLPASSTDPSTSSLLLTALPAQLSTQFAVPDHEIKHTARDSVTVVYEGSQSLKFNISYYFQNCTNNCGEKSVRYNTTCGSDMKCECKTGYMGPDCNTPICPENCSGKGSCVESTGVCKCDNSSSGVSCSERSSSQVTWSILSYDWVPDGYRTMAPRMGHSTILVTVGEEDKLLTFGGYDLLTLFADIWIFDPTSLTWSELLPHSTSKRNAPFSPSPRYFHCSVEMSPGVACIVGGITEQGLSNEVWCVDVIRRSWSKLPSPNLTPTAGGAIVRYSDTIWFLFGGMTEEGPSNSLWKYSVHPNIWQKANTSGYVPTMHGHTMTLYKNDLYVIGNHGNYKYNITSSKWSLLLSNGAMMPSNGRVVGSAFLGLQFHSAAAHDGVVYLVGGKRKESKFINQDVYAFQLETGSHVTITVDGSGAQLGSQLVQSDGRLYLIGGFNSSVHRTALAFDIRDNTCYLIKDKDSCTSYGCAWCESALYSPKPCFPSPMHSCRYGLEPVTPPCHLYGDCYTCAENQCYWQSSTCTMLQSNQSVSTCSDTCKDVQSCATCNTRAGCAWYKDSCADTSNVNISLERVCLNLCSGIPDCTRCTVQKGCSWSVHLDKCIADSNLDWFCLFNRCDLLVSPVQCPAECKEHVSCSVCNEYSHCGWCRTGTGGECISGDWAGPPEPAESRDVTEPREVCAAWNFFTCPPEDECVLDVHTCRDDQLCVDLELGYSCTCSNGTVNSDELDSCVPSCARDGCVNGDCVAVDTCTCHYGYYGADCSLKCDCSGHSVCAHNGTCEACQNSTAGARCELCLTNYVRFERNCVSCREICHGNSDNCVHKTDSIGLPLTVERVKCVDCSNHTEGDLCERCQGPHYFFNSVSLRCEECMCNKHAVTCDQETGLGCKCGDFTESSYKGMLQACEERNDCHLNQCDKCIEGYSGDPTNGSFCYEDLSMNTLFNFTGEVNAVRPIYIRAANTALHWIYIEMMNVSGIIHASTDPKKYDYKHFRFQIYKLAAYYTATQPELRPMRPWITGVEKVNYRFNDVTIDMNSERRLIKYSPYSGTSGLFIIVRTYVKGGELKIQWYPSEYKYDYYLTSNLIVSALILLVMAYCCMAKLIILGLYLWQQRVRRVALNDNSPKCLVSIQLDIGQDQPLPTSEDMTSRGYTNVTLREPLQRVAPLAIQEYHLRRDPVKGDVSAGLSTFLIKLPGRGPHPELVLGTSLFKICNKSLELVREQSDRVYCETAI